VVSSHGLRRRTRVFSASPGPPRHNLRMYLGWVRGWTAGATLTGAAFGPTFF